MSSFCFPNLLYFSNTMKNQISQLFLPREVKVHQWSKVKAAQSCLNPCDSIDYTVRGILQARILERVAVPFSRGSSQPRDQTQISCTAGRFFTSWANREAQEYWSAHSSLSCLQGILLTQESNWGLLNCRRIVYQLRYEGSLKTCRVFTNQGSSPSPEHVSRSVTSDSLWPHGL